LKDLGGIDIGKYVAGAIVVINLDTKQIKWTADLDLSTDTEKFRAYIYSSPTVVDLDGDGYLDILVGTTFGLFYVLDHHGNFHPPDADFLSCHVFRIRYSLKKKCVQD
jgi:hypothetical protein